MFRKHQKAALARETIFDDIWCVFFSLFLGGQQLWFLVTKPTISLVGSWASPYHLHLDHLSDQICQRRPESGEDQLGARHAVWNGTKLFAFWMLLRHIHVCIIMKHPLFIPWPIPDYVFGSWYSPSKVVSSIKFGDWCQRKGFCLVAFWVEKMS